MIFVVGVSCAGKTHTVQRLLALEPTFSRVSASGLLRELGRPLRPLTPIEAVENQRVLALELLSRGYAGQDALLLDGHATVETTIGPLPVPDDWYDALGFGAIVLVRAAPADISERRTHRGLPWSLDQAMRYQAFERSHAAGQAARLSTPFLEVGPEEVDSLPARLLDLVSNRGGGSGDR